MLGADAHGVDYLAGNANDQDEHRAGAYAGQEGIELG